MLQFKWFNRLTHACSHSDVKYLKRCACNVLETAAQRMLHVHTFHIPCAIVAATVPKASTNSLTKNNRRSMQVPSFPLIIYGNVRSSILFRILSILRKYSSYITTYVKRKDLASISNIRDIRKVSPKYAGLEFSFWTGHDNIESIKDAETLR